MILILQTSSINFLGSMSTENLVEKECGMKSSSISLPLRVIKQSPDQIILKNNSHKMIYRTVFLKNLREYQLLEKRTKLHHPNLLTFYKAEISSQSFANLESKEYFPQNQQQSLEECGVLFEFYVKTMRTCLLQYRQPFSEQEIINTFTPIIQAVEFMVKHNYLMLDITIDDIVLTEDNQVKIFDKKVLQINKSIEVIFDQIKVRQLYQKLAIIIYDLFFPEQTSKTWKNRLKVAESKLESQAYQFFINLYQKAFEFIPNKSKTKKIKKVNKIEISEIQKIKIKKQGPQFQQGKQNKIVQ